MKVYGYFRSSAAFRLRIAINLKGIECETELVDLQAGDQSSVAYLRVNPQGRVPTLVDDDAVLVQSLAIIEYLDETRPPPSLLPGDALGRARVRGIANLIACDIHPLNNLAVLRYLTGRLGASEADRDTWYRHWVKVGLDAVEAMMAASPDTGVYCHGDAPGLADICLVPQIFNAKRFDCPLDGNPTLMRVFDACMALPAFDDAQPAKQPEAANIA